MNNLSKICAFLLDFDHSFVDDVGGDALARCSDCTKYPAGPECCKDNKIFLISFPKNHLCSSNLL